MGNRYIGSKELDRKDRQNQGYVHRMLQICSYKFESYKFVQDDSS